MNIEYKDTEIKSFTVYSMNDWTEGLYRYRKNPNFLT